MDVARVVMCPLLKHRVRLVQFAGDVGVVVRRNAITFQFSGTVPQFVSLLHILAGQSVLNEIGIGRGERDVGFGEVWIEFDRPLEKRNGSNIALLIFDSKSGGILTQSLERRSGGLIERNVELLDRGQRLAQLAEQ